MAAPGTRVRARRSGSREAAAGTVAVTGAAGPIGRMLVERLVEGGRHKRVVAIDAERGSANGATWRVADVRDPALGRGLDGVDTVVHLATERDPDASPTPRRALNVGGTDVLLTAAAAVGVRRVVLLTSAMVYGAVPDNPVPLVEDAPVCADADLTLVGDWVEMEQLASRFAKAHPSLQVARVRPASLIGASDDGVHADGVLPRLFDAPRLLVIKGSRPHWQFCHVDDLLCALTWAVDGRVDGAVTVGSDGWLEHPAVEQISGMRSIVLPPAVAFATAERLHRVGVLPAPASELRYLTHPWVVGSQRLRAAGWQPRWTNEEALAAHLDDDARGERHGALRLQRKDATRAAAGAAVAVVGTVAIARARANRRRRRG
jgi:nucleoside-diphosphate-sugar epimerase